ncbi:MAG: insulinase family protein [Bacteroidetes bacterium]|nr:insulinase family protein [Bacteroidota bacterium]
MKKTITYLLAFIIAGTSLNAQDLSQKLPFDTSVLKGQLSNGLTYYIRHNEKPEKKAEMRLVVNAGSILEDPDQQGLAHFNEHMAFNGSTHFKKNELVSFLQSIGVQFGADLNAYTGFDETVYILPIPLTDTSNLRKGLTVLQDWAGGLSLDNDQIDAERGIILEESRLGKGADDRMMQKTLPLQYQGSLYAQRLPIGKDSIIKTFPYDAVKRFYLTWYRPDNMAVIIVGDIDVKATENLVKQYFGGLKNPANEKNRFYADVPSRAKDESIVVTDKEATSFFVEVDYPFYKIKPNVTLGDYKNDLIKSLFSSMLNQRLSELARGDKPPFLYAATGFGSYARGYEGFRGFSVAGKSGPDTALAALVHEIERVKQYGFTEAELERAKKRQVSYIEQSYNNRDKEESSNYVQEYINNFLTQEPSPGIALEYKYYNELLPTIKLDEVNALIDPLKKDPHIFVSLTGPSTSNFTMPGNEQLLQNTYAAMKAPVTPYTEKAVASALITKKPAAGTIKSETKNELLGTTEITFANGAKVILKPTDFKNDEILLTSFHKGGTSLYGAADKFNVNYAATIVQQMGIGNFSPTDLTKFLAGKNVGVAPRISGLSAGLSGSSSKKDFETMLQLIYLYATSPRKDEALFNAWKEKQKSAVEYAMQDPQTTFIDSLYQVYFQHNALMPVVVPRPSYFDNINLDRALEIYHEQLSDANDFTFIFTGSFNVDSIKDLLATYIGGLPHTNKTANFADNGVRPVNGDINLDVHKGTEEKSLILKFYTGEVKYDPQLALEAKALTEILNIKIVDDLREKLGAIYGGGIYGGLNKLPYNNFAFVMQLPCGPKNVDTLLKSADIEIANIKNDGPEASDLEKVKKTWLEQYKVQLKENSFWSSKLQGIYFENDDPQRIFDYDKNVNAITTDDIKKVANELLTGENVLTGVLYPEDK